MEEKREALEIFGDKVPLYIVARMIRNPQIYHFYGAPNHIYYKVMTNY